MKFIKENFKEMVVKARILQSAELYLERDLTIRQISKIIGVSKSTTGLDLTKRLMDLDPIKYQKVKQIAYLNKNKKLKRRLKHLKG